MSVSREQEDPEENDDGGSDTAENEEESDAVVPANQRLHEWRLRVDGDQDIVALTFSIPGDQDSLPYTARIHMSQADLLQRLLKFVIHTGEYPFDISSQALFPPTEHPVRIVTWEE